jgi:hypothetical protein
MDSSGVRLDIRSSRLDLWRMHLIMGSATDFMADAGSIRDALELRRLRLSEAVDLLAAADSLVGAEAGGNQLTLSAL